MPALNPFYRTRRPHWPFMILLGLFLIFATLQIAHVPAVWYDEGLNLNAARTLAQSGAYGLRSDGIIRLGDPAIQSGPPMIVPLAVLYQTFGANLAISRLFVTLCGTAALISLYTLVRRMFGAFPAFVTVLLLLVMPGSSTGTFVMMSRQVLGEIPAVLCITLGLHLILNERRPWWSGLLVGVCFGLAITLKSQILLVLSGTLGLWIIYILMRQRSEWRFWFSALAAMLFMYGMDSLWRSSMAGAQMAANLQTLREGILIHILPFRTLANLKQVSVWMALGLVTVTTSGTMLIPYAVPQAAKPTNRATQVQHFLMLFVGLWVAWFAFASIGWQRYAFVGVVFTLVLLSKGIAWVWQDWLKWMVRPQVYAGACLLCGVILSAMYLPTFLTTNRNDDFDAVVGYLQTDVPPGATIVSMEWPASYFADQDFVYPPTAVINALTAQIFLEHPFDPAMFDPLKACPQYLLTGPFTSQAIMQPALDAAQFTPVFDQGAYQVYTIPAGALIREEDGTCRAASRVVADGG